MDKLIPIDKLVRAKRRSIALIVERDGSLTVRAPKRAAMRDIEQFIHEKTEWIIRTREKLKSVVSLPKKQYANGEKFLFLGNEYELQIVKPQRPALKFNSAFTLGSTAQTRGAQLFTRWYKEQALVVFSERVAHYAKQYNFTPKQVKVTSAKTRWGSCSPNGTLNFTWRLVLAPLDVIDYVVLHELAHLRVKNHSPKFWKLVESMDAEYKSKRKWLRVHGEKLTHEG
jgi:predicted metal-dependent hydrolase